MDEALGIRMQKRKINEMNKANDNDFFTLYNNILYEKYNIKELNDSMFIKVYKRPHTGQV